jgi:hypothetical protein
MRRTPGAGCSYLSARLCGETPNPELELVCRLYVNMVLNMVWSDPVDKVVPAVGDCQLPSTFYKISTLSISVLDQRRLYKSDLK